VDEGRRGLHGDGQATGGMVGLGSKGVVAGSEHELGEVGGVGMCSDAEVAEHGVGFPSSDELDDVGVDAGAEERGSATRAKAAGGEELGEDAGAGGECPGGVAKGVGDETRGGGMLLPAPIPVGVDGRVRGRGVGPDVGADAREGFAGAKVVVVGGAMGDLLAADGVLLVGEGERCRGDLAKRILVIQRTVRGGNHAGAEGESDVLDTEGFGAALAVAEEVLGWAQEPVEANDAQEVGVPVSRPVELVVGVEGMWDVAEDGEVGRIGACGRVVGVAEGFEERSE
jgi:hypothetical protein